ncbi:hypothetical protein BRD56_04500 [Thermoplasmatales archaeon SW_10_69_26]|nr:MAG: hypothetical protein BRD56_04500 [Thermoplasmatales archaeon SW_10_69_26]
MTVRRPKRVALGLLGLGLIVLVALVPAASALDVSTKAIKAVGSDTYPDNVQSYAEQLEDVNKLDGRGGAIAVLDTGVDDDHPTFKNAFVAGARYDSDCQCIRDKEPLSREKIDPDDRDGHGTHVASTALGRGGGDAGPRGVAPGAALVDVKISNDVGFSVNGLTKGIDWVMDYNEGDTNWTGNTKVRTIVVSFADVEPQDEREYTPLMEKVREATEAGILVVPAAGNCGPDSGNVSGGCTEGGGEADRIPAPAATPEALAVGAVDGNDTVRRTQHTVAGYSSRGPNPADSADDETWRKPDVVAPGTNITAACPEAVDGYDTDCTRTGTSMAAPHVGGLAMIVWQALDRATEEQPTPERVKDLLTQTASDLGEEGWDKAAGYGYVDGYEAVVEATNTPPDPYFETVPADPEAGEEVTLDASDSRDPDRRDRIERYIWTIDGEREEMTREQPRLYRVFNETGSHEIELVAVDSHGRTSTEPFVRTIHVSESGDEEASTQAPDVELTHAQPVRVGEEAWFDLANSTDPDGHELVSFAWDFQANGSFEPDRETEAANTTWTFEEAGERNLQVEVTDETDATSRGTVTLTVEEPPPEPPEVAITNPQEGDVVEPGTVNVTWLASGGPVDTFGVSVDEVAVDETRNTFLEVRLTEEDATIAVQANGPGGTDVERVNVTVAEEESLERSSADEGDEEVGSNPPRATSNPDDEEQASEERSEPSREGGEQEPETATNGTADAQETPLGLTAVLAGVGLGARLTRRA